MKISNPRDAEDALRSLVDVEKELPASDAGNVRELLDAGEVSLAFDTLCTQLYEFDIRISPVSKATLDAVGRRLGLDPELWTVLEVSGPGAPGPAEREPGN
ncbi:MAG TPA: MafI family immunity protein [Microlunatus sp.]